MIGQTALDDVLITATPDASFALVGASVLDGAGGPALSQAAVVVRKGRIAAAGRRDDVPLEAGLRVIDATGVWVIPGLIDCHLHLTGDTSTDVFRRHLDPIADVKLLRVAAMLPEMLRMGCTQVRDVGSRNGVTLKNAVARRLVSGPRVLGATRALATTASSADIDAYPVHWIKESQPRATIVDGVEECRLAIRVAARATADLISVIASGACPTDGLADWTESVSFDHEEFAAIADEARRALLPLSVSAWGAAAVHQALEAGATSIEHGGFEPNSLLYQQIAERRVTLIPNLAAFEWAATGAIGQHSPNHAEAAKRRFDRQMRMVQGAHAAGIFLAVGTDRNGDLGPAGYQQELALLGDAGLNPMELLRAATQSGATACGLAATCGTLEVGKVADMIVLKRDPLTDPTVIGDPASISRIVQYLPDLPHRLGVS